jgi:hypothetical protein
VTAKHLCTQNFAAKVKEAHGVGSARFAKADTLYRHDFFRKHRWKAMKPMSKV